MNIAQIIDQHRSMGRWVGDGVRVECQCGHKSEGRYYGGPVTPETNAHRDADWKHAQHVAEMVRRDVQVYADTVAEVSARKAAEAEQERQWEAEKERQRQAAFHKHPIRAVERSTATKYQVSAFDREYPHFVVADLLRQAALSIGREEAIPTQIKIDRAPAGQGEKITLTWFA